MFFFQFIAFRTSLTHILKAKNDTSASGIFNSRIKSELDSMKFSWYLPGNHGNLFCSSIHNCSYIHKFILLKATLPAWATNYFLTKNHFLITGSVKKIPKLDKIEFLAHFWQYGSVTLFWLGQKTKSDFFYIKYTSYYWCQLF